ISCCIIFFSDVHSSAQLVQSEPAVVKPGNSHTLTCTASGFNFAGFWMAWIRQSPNGPLQWLCEIHPDGSTKNYIDSIKGQFTVSRDNSKNELNLKMDKMKTEDTAVYYCANVSIFYYIFSFFIFQHTVTKAIQCYHSNIELLWASDQDYFFLTHYDCSLIFAIIVTE
ncbi:unnamed protein product, partial [Staurois parvus]